MKKIIAFTGSNNSNSLNKQLLNYTTSKITGMAVETIDLRDYELPIYSVDLEKNAGFPDALLKLVEKLSQGDGYVIASPEHNGMMSAFLKNTLDWLSRSSSKYLGEKAPVFLLSTSPGKGGGAGNLAGLERMTTYAGGEVKAHYSLPSFLENFKNGQLVNAEENKKLLESVSHFKSAFESAEIDNF